MGVSRQFYGEACAVDEAAGRPFVETKVRTVPGSPGNLSRGSSARVIIVKIVLHADVSRFQPQRDENPASRLAGEGWWHPCVCVCVEPSDCS